MTNQLLRDAVPDREKPPGLASRQSLANFFHLIDRQLAAVIGFFGHFHAHHTMTKEPSGIGCTS